MIFNSLRINNYRAYYGRVSLIFLRRANGTSASFMLIMMWENLAFFQQFCSVCMDLKTAIISKISSM